MSEAKTPKALRRRGVFFPKKSSHYANICSVDFESVWRSNARLLERVLPEDLTAVLDFTPDQLEGEYDAKRNGYIGKDKHGSAVIGECHQLATVSFLFLKLFAYVLRLPGNYNPFCKPCEHKDTKLCGLGFRQTVAQRVVTKVHEFYPEKRFFWLFDAGFDQRDFYKFLHRAGDSFLTRIDKGSECTKRIERLIESDVIVLKQGNSFQYHEALLETAGFKLSGAYIKPDNEKIEAYWLVTNKELSGIEMKELYDKRSAAEPLHDYLKNDYNAKKPCSKRFSGAQSHTALLCLVHNIISLLCEHLYRAYLRLPTLLALLLETFTLQILFTTQVTALPPQNNLAISTQKK